MLVDNSKNIGKTMNSVDESTTNILQGNQLSPLDINSNSSVQPNILLRTPIFTPVARRTSTKSRSIDVNELQELEFSRNEGYESVKIIGAKLSIETDFKVWCGIIRVFQDHGYTCGQITLSFSQFAKNCGFPSKKINKELQERIDKSLNKIMTQVFSFSSRNGNKVKKYHMVQRAEYDVEENTITLTPDPSLWELYSLDHTTLLGLNIIKKLPRQDVAICLYLFIHALPQNPAPVSFQRFRTRLALTASVPEQNRSIKNALDKLIEIGYLKGDFFSKDRERYLLIHSRNRKVKLSDITPAADDA